ncbi:DUF6522 family protein [Paracoccus siganidrum]|uniref:Uncharacterized protein n=1 Tax=Paracoccus siganidrum TaxID=1276757 RepID=A0A419A9W1_9RHOB|nr:DUF6522 family protein [Paracoccus siganidrum]RJL19682.1 hypothetical protein D3P05_04490 [Paracoccus siganidrum]RMC35935.1 hypothetical protein C9E82_10660 [Paracoccus siganidrum]
MPAIRHDDNRFEVDAAMIADGFGIDAAQVAAFMRDGRITSRCEEGIEADAGRWRLTFYLGDRALRLTVDAGGQVLSRARFAAPRRGGAQAG